MSTEFLLKGSQSSLFALS